MWATLAAPPRRELSRRTLDHRHRRLGRDAPDLAPDVVIEHGVAEHEHAAAGEAVEQPGYALGLAVHAISRPGRRRGRRLARGSGPHAGPAGKAARAPAGARNSLLVPNDARCRSVQSVPIVAPSAARPHGKGAGRWSTRTLLKRIQTDGVEFVHLQFTDLLGTLKALTLPVVALPGALERGAWFDGSSIEGFARIE